MGIQVWRMFRRSLRRRSGRVCGEGSTRLPGLMRIWRGGSRRYGHLSIWLINGPLTLALEQGRTRTPLGAGVLPPGLPDATQIQVQVLKIVVVSFLADMAVPQSRERRHRNMAGMQIRRSRLWRAMGARKRVFDTRSVQTSAAADPRLNYSGGIPWCRRVRVYTFGGRGG